MSTSVKISELPVLASADAADEFVVVDDSAGVTKKITQAGLANFGTNALTAGTVSASGLVTASAGITFGADTLDDYEEGTWTPTVTKGTVNVVEAYYIKIGRLVYVQGQIDSFSDRVSTSGIEVDSLPFAVPSALDNAIGGSVFARYVDDAVHSIWLSTSGRLEFYTSSNVDFNPLTHSNLNNSLARIYFNALYRTA